MGQSPEGKSLNEQGKGQIFFQGRTDFRFRFPSVRLYTTEPNRMANAGDILLSVRAPVGDINLAYEHCCIGRGLAAITCQYNSYLYYCLMADKQAFGIFNTSGTVFGSINKDALNDFLVPFNENKLHEFLDFAKYIDEKIYILETHNRKLNELKQLYLKKFFD